VFKFLVAGTFSLSANVPANPKYNRLRFGERAISAIVLFYPCFTF